MRHWQGLGTVILVIAAMSGAQAADRSWTLQGGGLKIVTPCARTVDIQPGGEARQVTISASADHGAEIDRLRVAGGEVATIDAGGARCWLSGLFADKPTLALVIKVPEGAAIDISDGGVARYSVGAVGGALRLTLSGSGDATAASAKDLAVSLSGSGGSRVGVVSGKVTGNLSGSGNLTIDHVHAPSTDFEISGSGDAKLGDGDAGALSAALRGSGSLTVPAAASARLQASGNGDLAVASLDGPLDARLSGSGNVTVGAIETASASLETSGHSTVRLGAGTIGSFTVSSAGASEIGVDATVSDANISMVGAGELRLAKVTGHVSQSVTGAARVVVGGR